MSERSRKGERMSGIPYELLKKFPEYAYQPLDRIDKIDAVYTYADMTDPGWYKQYIKHMKKEPSPGRHHNYNELEYSIKSLRIFCPFIDKIYIVTAGPIPAWYDPLDTQINIIDQNEILGEECIKPTFKSTSVEAYLHRIPGLSECFMYLNDDYFIGNYLTKEMWFQNNLPVVDMYISKWDFNIPDIDTFQNIQPVEDGKNTSRAKLRKNVHVAHLYHTNRCIYRKFGVLPNLNITHQAHLLRKSCMDDAWRIFYPELKQCVAVTRTRSREEVHMSLLSHFTGAISGRMLLRLGKESPMKMMSVKLHKQEEIDRCLETRPHLFCINHVNEDSAEAFKNFMGYHLISHHFHSRDV